jgi:hypothetical protein
MSHLSELRRRPATAIALPLVLLAGVGVSACGSSSSTTGTTVKAAANATPSTATSTAAGAPTKGAAPASAAAPGSSAAGAGTPPGAPVRARFTAMRQCLQQNGISLPKRPAGGGGAFLGPQLPKGVTRAHYLEVLRKCGGRPPTPGAVGAGRRFSNPHFRQALVSFAACLRQNGVNLPAPNTNGKGPIFNTRGIDTASPQFRQAERKCRTTLLGALRAGKVTPPAAGG